MQTKRVKCPKCGVVLDVRNSQNEEIKQITCPSCKSSLRVKFSIHEESLEAQTYYAPSSKTSDSCKTQLVSNNSNTVNSASLLFNNQEYKLEDGLNIIGRKGSTSNVTIQIDTHDRYMSRMHCSIMISSLPDGTKKVVLSNYQNKNQTCVDNQRVEEGDAIRLVDGNIIIMGHTEICFKMS